MKYGFIHLSAQILFWLCSRVGLFMTMLRCNSIAQQQNLTLIIGCDQAAEFMAINVFN